MDLRQLLGKLDLIEGTMAKAEKHPAGPKFTGQWKGTDKGTPGKKYVGDSVEHEESILKDLAKGPTPKTKEQELAEQFEQFLSQLEEENLGVADKRPARKGSRPQRDMGKTGEPSKRYKTIKESVDDLLTSFREGWRDIEQTDIYHTETKKVMKRFYDLMRDALMREDLDQFWWAYEKFSSDYPDAFVNFLDDCGLGSIDEIESKLMSVDEAVKPSRVSMPYDRWSALGPDEQARLRRDNPGLKIVGEPKASKPRVQREKPNYDRVMFDIDNAIGQAYPDGEPFDYLTKYDIETLDKAVRANKVGRSFNDYVADVWEQHMQDNPASAGGMDYNPFRESRDPHRVITQKLQDIERSKNPQAPADDLEARAARAKAEYAKYVAKMKKKNPNYIPLYKVDEAGANNPPQNTSPQQQQMAKNVAQGTQALKAATGTAAPTNVLAKAIDTASQGTAIDAKSAQALEPTMDIIKQVAQDPNLANQFKSFASQAKTSAAKQQLQQKKP